MRTKLRVINPRRSSCCATDSWASEFTAIFLICRGMLSFFFFFLTTLLPPLNRAVVCNCCQQSQQLSTKVTTQDLLWKGAVLCNHEQGDSDTSTTRKTTIILKVSNPISWPYTRRTREKHPSIVHESSVCESLCEESYKRTRCYSCGTCDQLEALDVSKQNEPMHVHWAQALREGHLLAWGHTAEELALRRDLSTFWRMSRRASPGRC